MNRAELEAVVRDEIIQRREEGCDVSGFNEAFEAAVAKPSPEAERELEALLSRLEAASPSGDFPYHEPSTLEEIRRSRPDGPRRIPLAISDAELEERILGAWLGRCAGCTLGKPVEGWPRERIEKALKSVNAYPLDYYFPRVDPPTDEYPINPNDPCLAENIRAMARDDDIDYTILGLHTLEENGLDFTSRDIANQWLSHLPYHMVYTAERAAYRNLVNGLEPPDSAVFRNPYREWIGAQIRADAFGYVAPGMPEVAAEFAFRDAAVSHVKNGIYGEMFVAAMLAAAFTTSNMEEIITIGLSEIPQNSRLAEAVRDVLDWSKKFPRWESAWEQVMQKYGGYHGVHTINNAAIVLLGLLYGGNDLTQTISIAVMGGLDTDCNGATAGSILGAAEGASALPSRWTAPLNDTIRSVVVGFDNSRISDLAARTVSVAKRVRERFGR